MITGKANRKEMFARRPLCERAAKGPFITVNSGAIPKTCVRRAVRYEKGAFTGASERERSEIRVATEDDLS